MAMKNNDEFLRDLYMVHDGRIVPLERYAGGKRKILFKCNICGNEWKTTPNNIMKTKNCPKCSLEKKARERTLTHIEFIETAKEKMGQLFHDYEVLGKYEGIKRKIKIRHKICGYEWEITPGNFYVAKTCPKCHGRVDGKISKERRKKNMKTNEEFEKELKEVWGNEYTPLEKYGGYNFKILTRHEKCGYEWKTRAGTLLKGHGCPKCGGNYRRTTEDYRKELEAKFGKKLRLISDFTDVKTDVIIQCDECGEIFTRNAGYLINSDKVAGCPVCRPISSGEEVVRRHLVDSGIYYITQFPIKVDNQTLRFDFAIYNRDRIVAFIEYHGEQHYQPIEFFGGLKAFKQQKERDNIKKNYCKTNNISLIEIPYWENDIKNYLEKQLDMLNEDIQLALS